MRHGVYVGPVESLRGEKALLRESPGSKDDVEAQFDGRSYLSPYDPDQPRRGGWLLTVGWHTFKATDFEEDDQ